MAKLPTISICMIVKNEEKNLPRLLSSVGGLADEVIVVDTGSTDDTVQIAKSYDAKVYYFEWCDDFSAARNESLRYATKDCILWLDADDEIYPEDARKIKKHLEKNSKAAVFLRLKNIQEDGIFESSQLRIFPNRLGIEFEGRIHEQVYYSVIKKGIPFSHCDAVVHHLGYANEINLLEKIQRNQKMLEREIEKKPDDFISLFFLARTIKGMNKKKESLHYLDRAIEIGEHDETVAETAIYKLAFIEKACVLCDYRRPGEAIELLEGCIEKFPKENLIRFTLGELYFQTKDYNRAYDMLLPLEDADFKEELLPMDLNTTKKNLYNYLGISSLYKSDFRTAIKSIKQSIQIEKHDLSSYHYLSLAYEKAFELDNAIKACRQGLDVFEEDPFLRKRLFLLYVDRGLFQEAVEEYAKLNGSGADLEITAAMFFVKCKTMDMEGIIRYYQLLQKDLNMPLQQFPEGFASVKERMGALQETKAFDKFNSAICFLLNAAT